MTKLIIETPQQTTLGGHQGALIRATAVTEDDAVREITTTISVSYDGNALIDSDLFNEIVELSTDLLIERMRFDDDKAFEEHLAQVMLMQRTEVVLPGAGIYQVGSVLMSIVSLGKPVRC